MLNQRRQYGKYQLFTTSMKAGERNLISRDPSVGDFASSNPSLMKLMENLDEATAPFCKTMYSSLPQSFSISFWNIAGVVNSSLTTCYVDAIRRQSCAFIQRRRNSFLRCQKLTFSNKPSCTSCRAVNTATDPTRQQRSQFGFFEVKFAFAGLLNSFEIFA